LLRMRGPDPDSKPQKVRALCELSHCSAR